MLNKKTLKYDFGFIIPKINIEKTRQYLLYNPTNLAPTLFKESVTFLPIVRWAFTGAWKINTQSGRYNQIIRDCRLQSGYNVVTNGFLHNRVSLLTIKYGLTHVEQFVNQIGYSLESVDNKSTHSRVLVASVSVLVLFLDAIDNGLGLE